MIISAWRPRACQRVIHQIQKLSIGFFELTFLKVQIGIPHSVGQGPWLSRGGWLLSWESVQIAIGAVIGLSPCLASQCRVRKSSAPQRPATLDRAGLNRCRPSAAQCSGL